MQNAQLGGVRDPHGRLILSYIHVRRFVGIVGATTPALVIVYFVMTGEEWTRSISDAYHTGAREVIVGGLSAIAVFLWAYKGYENDGRFPTDKQVARVAAVSAFVAAHFPNKIVDGVSLTWTQMVLPEALVGGLHYVATFTFYAALGVFCFFNFCRSAPGEAPSDAKIDRVFLYRSAGIGILLTAIAIVFVFLVLEDKKTYIFWLESVGVWMFSVCWLVKGKTLRPVVRLVHVIRH